MSELVLTVLIFFQDFLHICTKTHPPLNSCCCKKAKKCCTSKKEEINFPSCCNKLTGLLNLMDLLIQFSYKYFYQLCEMIVQFIFRLSNCTATGKKPQCNDPLEQEIEDCLMTESDVWVQTAQATKGRHAPKKRSKSPRKTSKCPPTYKCVPKPRNCIPFYCDMSDASKSMENNPYNSLFQEQHKIINSQNSRKVLPNYKPLKYDKLYFK
ncbi:hypothetical protein SNEBB_005224 [Seison nebaliae]|nr:hypothetical protein SNEBB_005224 [Seison nebaliae]